ncbi:MAG: hypothetical protein ASUL_03019 [Candidatus Aramenus sulfurataquae]|uniref:Uncharacterized protein n=2 Tax=Candidatus Aramenus sulfurataquae TaxID=1326980 RepID=W7KXE2_9CREN|nr:MAG: hypothetical protein ASUL_03019 [Candidatus Aramenus sulfurataquae]MCL7344682.1 hypothetical protein [Candidatus Aramenus sulfurataquae]
MQILAELHPKANREKLLRELDVVSSFDGYDIPDSPLGLPSVLPSTVAVLIRERLGEGKRIIINQRLYDVNELFVYSLSYSAKAFNFEIAYTKGDKPKVGREVGYLSSEEGVNISKSLGVRAGMMLSLRKSREEVLARLESNADFFLGLHFSGVDSLKGLKRNVIPYLIVMTEKNKNFLSSLTQPTFKEEDVPSVLSSLESYVDAVLLSSPGDLDFFRRFSRKA